MVACRSALRTVCLLLANSLYSGVETYWRTNKEPPICWCTEIIKWCTQRYRQDSASLVAWVCNVPTARTLRARSASIPELYLSTMGWLWLGLECEPPTRGANEEVLSNPCVLVTCNAAALRWAPPCFNLLQSCESVTWEPHQHINMPTNLCSLRPRPQAYLLSSRAQTRTRCARLGLRSFLRPLALSSTDHEGWHPILWMLGILPPPLRTSIRKELTNQTLIKLSSADLAPDKRIVEATKYAAKRLATLTKSLRMLGWRTLHSLLEDYRMRERFIGDPKRLLSKERRQLSLGIRRRRWEAGVDAVDASNVRNTKRAKVDRKCLGRR